MKRSLEDIYIENFARPRFARFHRFLYLLGLRGLGVLNYQNEEQSGETYFLKSIVSEIDREGRWVLDVGANEGDIAASVLAASERLKVLAIEPHPQIFARLKARFLGEARIELENIGAGAKDATLSLFDYDDREGTGHASFFKDVIEGIHRGRAKSVDVPVRPLDPVVAEHKADIALIKIDVEGFEFEVLCGLASTIEKHDVRYVIVEFNEMNVVSGSFVKNFIDMLPGYKPYRILPMGHLLPLEPYHALFVEIFAYQNIVFVKS
jgi:FkbM family methyltransferase